jgi:hypothetical protein
VCTVIGEEMRRKAAAWEWKRRAGRVGGREPGKGSSYPSRRPCAEMHRFEIGAVSFMQAVHV